MRASQSQGRDEIFIEAPAATVFAVLQDSTLLHKWMLVVKSTNGNRETAGAVRECQVSMSGRDGYVTEECIECVPDRRIAWRLVKDNLGFDKMLKYFWFSFDLAELGAGRTRVITQSYFEPRGLIARIMVSLMINKKFKEVRQTGLAGLKLLSEEHAEALKKKER